MKKKKSVHNRWSDIVNRSVKGIKNYQFYSSQRNSIKEISIGFVLTTRSSPMDPMVADPVRIPAEIYPHAANKSSNQIDIDEWWGEGTRRNWFPAASKSRPRVRNETTMGEGVVRMGGWKRRIDSLWGFMLHYFLSSIPPEMRRDTESFLRIFHFPFFLPLCSRARGSLDINAADGVTESSC